MSEIRNPIKGQINQDISKEIRMDVKKMPKLPILAVVLICALFAWFYSGMDRIQVYEGEREVKVYESVEEMEADSDVIVEVSNANYGSTELSGLYGKEHKIEEAYTISNLQVDVVHKNKSGKDIIPLSVIAVCENVFYSQRQKQIYRINKDFLMHNQGKYLLFLKKGMDPQVDIPYFEPLSIVYGKVVLSEPEPQVDERPKPFREKQPQNIRQLHDKAREKYGK